MPDLTLADFTIVYQGVLSGIAFLLILWGLLHCIARVAEWWGYDRPRRTPAGLWGDEE